MRASPFAQTWGDMLLGLALKGFTSARYWAAHKLRGTPPRLHANRERLDDGKFGPTRGERKRAARRLTWDAINAGMSVREYLLEG